ncbi:MAG: methyltransferase, CheR-type [Planctomycetaceae bacterium]|nr:methyltransferase, CheR-type [Planctomycetaceae bacterium]
MIRESNADQFRYIVFPHEERQRHPINLASGPTGFLFSSQAEEDLPEQEVRFLSWLFRKAGLDVRQYRSETLHRRLTACLRTLRTTSLIQARQLLEQDPKLVTVALSAMLVGVTSFFRDPVVFEHLRTEILPELAHQKKGIYAWSAGCSDGAELYSLAMILADLNLLSGSYLLGTDCREDAVERARAGIYQSDIAKNLPIHCRRTYFEECGQDLRVSPAIRTAVRWRASNMLAELEAGLWDLILFRNTSMYFRSEATATLWPRLEAALIPGGVLVVGRAERPHGVQRLSSLRPCLYRRNRGS